MGSEFSRVDDLEADQIEMLPLTLRSCGICCGPTVQVITYADSLVIQGEKCGLLFEYEAFCRLHRRNEP